MDYDLQEKMADAIHDQWSGWMEYLFDKSEEKSNGSVVIPRWAVERWTKQMNTKYDDLTKEEQDFVKRVGYRSLFNLLTPFVIGKNNFEITTSIKANFGFGYTMSPFGDFIDENIWLSFNDKLNIHTYFRQFQNRNTWFYGGGINIVDYPIHDKFIVSSARFLFVL